MARILAIDYGVKRTGFAWTDPQQIIASGLDTVDTPKIEAFIKKIFQTEDIETIVLGFPLQADGSDTHATQPVRDFAQNLDCWFPDIDIHLTDEQFSSKMALDEMIRAGVPKKRRSDKRLINQVAATLILQSFLEEKSY